MNETQELLHQLHDIGDWTWQAIAERCGVTRQCVWDWRTGAKEPGAPGAVNGTLRSLLESDKIPA